MDIKVTPELISPKWGTVKNPTQEEKEALIPMKDQATIVIGGLFKEVTVTSEWKIPLLGDLPLLRYAFRTQGESRQKTEVITFITPKIVTEE